MPREVPRAYCNRSVDSSAFWPFPGFEPQGTLLASLFEDQLYVLDVARAATVLIVGKKRIPPAPPSH